MNAIPALDLASLRRWYAAGHRPRELVALLRPLWQASCDMNVWIHLLSEAELEPFLATLDGARPELPLYGIPFAIKDNIDLAGIPTTAACPDYAYTPTESAQVVARLIALGAIPVGKTNLDQFATGLVGTRSPYGAVPNALNPEYVSGGSSSGSAVAVAGGLVSFALGTDTAGSGRVPAALNNLIGVKPTRGLLSSWGMLPACRTLDCLSIFSLNIDDADALLGHCAAYDAADPYARPLPAHGRALGASYRLGVPKAGQLDFDGDSHAEALYQHALSAFETAGASRVEIDLQPFLDAARLLYEGPWVAERYAAIEDFIRAKPDSLHPVTRAIIEPAIQASAVAGFKAHYRLAELRRQAETQLAQVDALLLPTLPTAYTTAQVLAEPIARNSALGRFTNFMNLLDLAGLAVPAGFLPSGVGYGVTLVGPAFSDRRLLQMAHRYLRQSPWTQGATRVEWQPAARVAEVPEGYLEIAVCGAHLSGMPLNPQLTSRGALLMESTTTAPCYRLYALAGGPPRRPGLVRTPDEGAAIQVEVWAVPQDEVGGFLALIPAPLGLGSTELASGRWVKGFICEPCGMAGAEDISDWGGWRAYMASLA